MFIKTRYTVQNLPSLCIFGETVKTPMHKIFIIFHCYRKYLRAGSH